jgi:hypothetical protein
MLSTSRLYGGCIAVLKMPSWVPAGYAEARRRQAQEGREDAPVPHVPPPGAAAESTFLYSPSRNPPYSPPDNMRR